LIEGPVIEFSSSLSAAAASAPNDTDNSPLESSSNSKIISSDCKSANSSIFDGRKYSDVLMQNKVRDVPLLGNYDDAASPLETLREEFERKLKAQESKYQLIIRNIREEHEQALQALNMRLFIATTALENLREEKEKLDAIVEQLKT
jgi:hypothetical protein